MKIPQNILKNLNISQKIKYVKTKCLRKYEYELTANSTDVTKTSVKTVKYFIIIQSSQMFGDRTDILVAVIGAVR